MTLLRTTFKLLAATVAIAVATGALAAGPKIIVIGGKADDPFWSRVKKGTDDAALVASAPTRPS